jgi:hypothetical protein
MTKLAPTGAELKDEAIVTVLMTVLMMQVDTNQDGEIDFTEFVQLAYLLQSGGVDVTSIADDGAAGGGGGGGAGGGGINPSSKWVRLKCGGREMYMNGETEVMTLKAPAEGIKGEARVGDEEQFSPLYQNAEKSDAGLINPASDWYKFTFGDRALYRRRADERLSLVAPEEGVKIDAECPDEGEFNRMYAKAEDSDALLSSLTEEGVPGEQGGDPLLAAIFAHGCGWAPGRGRQGMGCCGGRPRTAGRGRQAEAGGRAAFLDLAGLNRVLSLAASSIPEEAWPMVCGKYGADPAQGLDQTTLGRLLSGNGLNLMELYAATPAVQKEKAAKMEAVAARIVATGLTIDDDAFWELCAKEYESSYDGKIYGSYSGSPWAKVVADIRQACTQGPKSELHLGDKYIGDGGGMLLGGVLAAMPKPLPFEEINLRNNCLTDMALIPIAKAIGAGGSNLRSLRLDSNVTIGDEGITAMAQALAAAPAATFSRLQYSSGSSISAAGIETVEKIAGSAGFQAIDY